MLYKVVTGAKEKNKTGNGDIKYWVGENFNRESRFW